MGEAKGTKITINKITMPVKSFFECECREMLEVSQKEFNSVEFPTDEHLCPECEDKISLKTIKEVKDVYDNQVAEYKKSLIPEENLRIAIEDEERLKDEYDSAIIHRHRMEREISKKL